MRPAHRCACRRSCSRWGPIRDSTRMSASASSPASCPIATRGIRSRRRSTHLRGACGRCGRHDSAVAGRRPARSRRSPPAARRARHRRGRRGHRTARPRCSSCFCPTRRSSGWAASASARSARRSSPPRHRRLPAARSGPAGRDRSDDARPAFCSASPSPSSTTPRSTAPASSSSLWSLARACDRVTWH